MSSRLDVQKAIQAAGVLLRREGKRMSHIRLLKLLYIADRRSIQERGMPILGSRLVALKHGPLHSEVYDLINGIGQAEPLWSSHFRNSGRDICLETEPGVGQLSRHEVGLFNRVSDELAAMDDWEVADITHEFDEWRKNYPDPRANTSRTIPLEDVIEAVGRAGDMDSILQDIRDREAFAEFFSELSAGGAKG